MDLHSKMTMYVTSTMTNLVYTARNQFVKQEIEILWQLFELATIFKFTKE